MTNIYFLSKPTTNCRGVIRMRYGGRPSWAFLERCEDGLALLSKPAVLYVTLVDRLGCAQKLRAVRFRKQESLNNWVTQYTHGLRKEGYDVSYMD